jgi:hypothetical protein
MHFLPVLRTRVGAEALNAHKIAQRPSRDRKVYGSFVLPNNLLVVSRREQSVALREATLLVGGMKIAKKSKCSKLLYKIMTNIYIIKLSNYYFMRTGQFKLSNDF